MAIKKTVQNIPEKKTKAVAELKNLIKNKKTILIASIKNLPASQYQEVTKKLREKAEVRVPKKNLIFKAIDESKNENIKKLREQIKEDIAILFSDWDAFDLAFELLKSKSRVKAKPGQDAPYNIEVEEGPTDLIPGPAVSELGSVGIEIKIEKGKIYIAKPKVIVKKGQRISRAAADVMSKLDIKPFSIGFIPLSAFDSKEGKLYVGIEINQEETIKMIKEAYSKALPFAVEIGYPTSATISFLISKASIQERALEKLIQKHQTPEETKMNNESSGEEK